VSIRRRLLLAALLASTACNRAGFRLIGASTAFPDTATGQRATHTRPDTIAVLPPVDARPQHYGERIAGTRWKACSTDGLPAGGAPSLIAMRLSLELSASQAFAEVQGADAPADALALRTSVHAFCAQTVGFFFVRVAGIVSLDWAVTRDGRVLLEGTTAHVVTDADPEYTGSPVSTIEQTMHQTLAAALRLALRDIVSAVDERLPEDEP